MAEQQAGIRVLTLECRQTEHTIKRVKLGKLEWCGRRGQAKQTRLRKVIDRAGRHKNQFRDQDRDETARITGMR